MKLFFLKDHSKDSSLWSATFQSSTNCCKGKETQRQLPADQGQMTHRSHPCLANPLSEVLLPIRRVVQGKYIPMCRVVIPASPHLPSILGSCMWHRIAMPYCHFLVPLWLWVLTPVLVTLAHWLKYQWTLYSVLLTPVHCLHTNDPCTLFYLLMTPSILP